ncbi:MAG: sigma-54 dependent transcriptional regulator [Desulfocapsaceae bacterium]|nr:sigma-54 dependent transcriptional regulator [Desulfocapsaceae bacterium]
MERILIIDDDIEACETIESLISRLSHHCDMAHTIHEGRRLYQKNDYDVVFLDVGLPDGSGLDLLPEIVQIKDAPEVIILTGKGDADGAELAIKGGVWDYLLKPSSVREITLTLNRALKYRAEKESKSEKEEVQFQSIIGESQGIQASLKMTRKAARSDASVLITGETGTGKELFARTIHDNSKRAKNKFVVVDCASLPVSLVESTLFGHVKGAFTGAQKDTAGLVKLADGGTLFLDEIGEMPLSLQKVFLRVLQEHHFRPVGGANEEKSNFRLIAATNRDLEAMVDEGKFRSDLFFRIKTMRIRLPALRHRVTDIRPLIESRMKYLCNQYGLEPKNLGDDFLATLSSYSWPGNVRELFNILERAMVDAGDEQTLFSVHLSRELRIQVAKMQIEKMTGKEILAEDNGVTINEGVRKIGQKIFEDIFDSELPQLKEFKATVEKIYLSELIRQCDGEISKIIERSGLSRSHFYTLLKKYGLTI